MDHREIVIWRRSYYVGTDRLAGSQSYRERARSLHDMVIGDDVAGLVPDKASAALHLGLVALGKFGAGALANHLDDRGRYPLEEFDGRAFHLREVAARLDRAGRGRRKQALFEIGSQGDEAEQNDANQN